MSYDRLMQHMQKQQQLHGMISAGSHSFSLYSQHQAADSSRGGTASTQQPQQGGRGHREGGRDNGDSRFSFSSSGSAVPALPTLQAGSPLSSVASPSPSVLSSPPAHLEHPPAHSLSSFAADDSYDPMLTFDANDGGGSASSSFLFSPASPSPATFLRSTSSSSTSSQLQFGSGGGSGPLLLSSNLNVRPLNELDSSGSDDAEPKLLYRDSLPLLSSFSAADFLVDDGSSLSSL